MRKWIVSGLLIVAIWMPSDVSAHRARRGHVHYPHHASVWDDLDHCESTHGAGSPNRFQFTLRTWRSMPERAGIPHTHTYEEQLASAKALVLRSGWGQFPACGWKINARNRPM